MSLSPNTQAILLLTAHFSKAGSGDAKPLGPKEWGTFALWLREQSLMPESLLSGNPETRLAAWSDNKITRERLLALLNRGSALGLALEKWLRAGLWVMTRSDADYPKRLKQQLKNDSPPILFGCGNRSLLNQGGIAVVGSRDTSDADLTYSRELGSKAAAEGFSIVSGGARGVDETAMLGALDAEGTVIGVLADSLLRACSSAKYRQHLMRNNLVLVSPFYPEAGFNAGNAMQRNRYIYCLADAAVAVHSGLTGGTWSGALENLKKGWVPLWVKTNDDPAAGNAQLIAQGAHCLSPPITDLRLADLLKRQPATVYTPLSVDLFAQPAIGVRESVIALEPGKVDEPAAIIETCHPCADSSIYQFFLGKLESLCSTEPQTVEALAASLELEKAQLNTWLKRAVEENRLDKLARPIRYQWQTIQQKPLL